MLNRITQSMMSSQLIQDLADTTTRLSQAQQQVATGKKITQPSDDPLGAQQDIQLRNALAGTTQYQSNVADGEGWLTSTDDALSQISDVVNRVQELTVQGASDTSGPSARQAIADEINQLIDEVKQTANTQYEGSYIFGGTATTTPPYTTGSDTYQGDSGTVARTIGPGVSVQINTLGGANLLGSGGGDGKLLDVLRTISTHLTSGTTADANSLRTTDISALQSAVDQISTARATVGATMDRLDSAKSRLADVQLNQTKALSDTEDADLPTAMINYTNQQNVLQAALQSGAKIIQPSLLDFLN